MLRFPGHFVTSRSRPLFIGAVALTACLSVSTSALASSGQKPNDRFLSYGLNDRSSVSANLLSGNVVVTATDLSIKGVGQDLQITRVYNSQNDADGGAPDGSFGKNFRAAPLDARVANASSSSSDRTFTPGDGTQYRFARSGGSYVTPPQIAADLDGATGSVLTYRSSRTTWSFDGSGNLAVRDRNGNTVRFNGATGGTTIATDVQGRAITGTRNASGALTQITDPTSRHSSYAYGSSGASAGRLVTFTDAAGNDTTYGYDAGGRMNRITTPGGRITKLSYDGSGRVATITRVTNATTEAGNVTSFAYGQTDSRCGNDALTTGVTKVTDARGAVTSYCPSSTTADAAVLDVIDALGHHQKTSYSPKGEITAQGTGSALTNSSYNANGTLASSLRPAGEKTSYAYSGSGPAQYQPSSVTDPDQHVQSFGYDANGNLTSVADAADPANAKNKATLTYNGDGTIATAKDGENHLTGYGYYGTADGIKKGYLKTITPASVTSGMVQLGVTTLEYDTLGHVTKVTDGNGKQTRYSYDALDRTRTITFDGGSTVTYDYDADGNQTERADSAGGTYTYGYDLLNRRTHEGLPGSRSVDYTYDQVDSLETLTDGSGTTRYGYDAANQTCFVAVTTATSGSCASPPSGATTFAYDDRGNRTRTTFPTSTVSTVEEDYDDSDKPVRITVKRGTSVTDKIEYGYSSFAGGASGELLASQARTNGTTGVGPWNYNYNAGGQLIQASRTEPSGVSNPTVTRSYAYDKAGNRTQKTTSPNPVGGGTETLVYRYNEDNQLCVWGQSYSTPSSCAGVASATFPLRFDAAGNDLGFGYRAVQDPIDPDPDPDPGEEPCTPGTRDCQEPETPNPTYHGVPVSGYKYNDRNQMTSAESFLGGANGYVSQLSYGGPNQFELVSAQAPATGANLTVENNLLGVGRRIGSTSSIYSAAYTRDPSGRLLTRRSGASYGTSYYYVLDAQGSVIQTIASDGVGIKYGYDPDGNLDQQVSGSTPSDFGYTGAYLQKGGTPTGDQDNVLYHNGLRWYDPRIARWTQPDSIDQPGDLQNANRYAYVGNNPVNYIDPTGQIGCATFGIGGICKAASKFGRDVGEGVKKAGPARLIGGVTCGYGLSKIASGKGGSAADIAITAVGCGALALK